MCYYQYPYFFQLISIPYLELEIDKGLDVAALDLQDALDEDNKGHHLDQKRCANVSPFHFAKLRRGNGVNGDSQQKQQHKELAGLEEYGQIGKVERVEHLAYDLPSRSKTVGAEENPQEDDKMQGDKPTNYPSYTILFQLSFGDFLPQFVYNKTHAMHSTPEDELPIGTVP